MFLVVGLGNPGKEYSENRHNMGFMAADELVRRFSLSDYTGKFQGLIASGTLAGEKVYVLKPMTFMNLSGNSVAAAASFYKIAPENILVIHDDLDLLPGDLRVKQGGSSAGHNGLKSIDAHIGKDYWRARIGIGHPGIKEIVSDYVLDNPCKEDQKLIQEKIDKLIEILPLFMQDKEKFKAGV